jgi:hypothetical protein
MAFLCFWPNWTLSNGGKRHNRYLFIVYSQLKMRIYTLE